MTRNFGSRVTKSAGCNRNTKSKMQVLSSSGKVSSGVAVFGSSPAMFWAGGVGRSHG